MSMNRCHICGLVFDEDYNVEHIEECEESHIIEIAGNNINLAEITRD